MTGLLLISLLAAAIYSNTFSASFHFDDVRNIAENPWIKNLSYLHDLSGSRYVGFLSFALNYHFGQLNLFGYHLVNLLIHITNGFLVYLLVRLLFRAAHSNCGLQMAMTSDSKSAIRNPQSEIPFNSQLTAAFWIAFSTALLFVVHPVQTQAVTYIVQRFTSLATLFYLLTVVCYLKWRLDPPQTKSRSLWYAGALITTILAMKTKEITFTLPFMLLLIEAVFFAPLLPPPAGRAGAGRHGTRKSWLRLIPFFLTLPIIPLSRPGALGEGEAGLARATLDISRLDYLFTQFRVIVTYLRLLIFPVHQNLDYDYPVYHSLFDPPVFFSFLVLSALLALVIYLLVFSRRPAAPLMAFGIFWFFLTLSIESSIIPIRDVIYEHRLYLPSVGFFLTAAAAAVGGSDRLRLWKAMGIAVIVAVLAVATYQRNKVWEDELALWSDVVRKSPNKARGYDALGGVYSSQKRWEEAIQEYKTALTLKPNYAEAHVNLGNAYKALGRIDEAIEEYQTALTFKSHYDAQAHNNLGSVYQEQGRRDEAIREYQTALSLKPDYADTYYNLGLIYHDLGKLTDALLAFRQAAQLQPDEAGFHNNLGNVYQELGRRDEAIREYQTALSLKPDYAEVHINLGNAYKALGRLDKAIQEYQTALTLKSHYDAQIHNSLGSAYQELGRRDEAIREYQTALSLKPDYAEAHYNLGAVYKSQGRLDEAVQEYQAALALNHGFAEAHNSLGNIYQRQGRREEAVQAYKTAIAVKPDYSQAHYNLGVVYYAQGRLSDALLAFQKSIQLKPDYAEAHNNLGYVYFEQKRMKKAVQEFQIALQLKPDLTEAYYNLGQTYQRMGQTQNAVHAFEQALQIKPDNDKARQALKSLRQ